MQEASTPKDPMPLRCQLGFHQVPDLPVWNEGFYFGRCARCGRDVVRTAFESWHVPRGFRVVWQAHRPVDAAVVGLISAEASEDDAPDPDAVAASEDQTGTPPIAEADDLDAVAPPEPSPDAAIGSEHDQPGATQGDEDAAAQLDEAEAPAPPRPRSSIPDFMTGPDVDTWTAVPFDRVQAYVSAGDAPPRDAAPRDPFGARAGRRYRKAASGGREAFGKVRGAAARWMAAASAHRRALGIGLAAIVLIPLLLWSAMALRDADFLAGGSDGAAVRSDGLPPTLPAGREAFVTTRALNCRAAPAREARSVSVLSRGERVEILARDGEWLSLAHRGGQCWSIMRYVSTERPA